MMNTAPLRRISPFFKPEVSHEPPSSSRGDEAMGTVCSYLDAAPLGRQAVWEDSPAGYLQTPPYKWWNWHDNYEAEKSVDPTMSEAYPANSAPAGVAAPTTLGPPARQPTG
jgi:hypothetical protein